MSGTDGQREYDSWYYRGTMFHPWSVRGIKYADMFSFIDRSYGIDMTTKEKVFLWWVHMRRHPDAPMSRDEHRQNHSRFGANPHLHRDVDAKQHQ